MNHFQKVILPQSIAASVKLWTLLLFVCAPVSLFGQSTPQITQGKLDLSSYQWKQNGPLKLQGDWQFFEQQLLTPSDWTQENSGKFIPVPASWKGIEQENLPNFGFGTYVLTLQLPRTETPMAVSIPPIRSASKIWANGQLLLTTGQVGNTEETTEPQYSSEVVILPPHEGEIVLLVQVANFHHRAGGMVNPITIGPATQILSEHQTATIIEVFLMGGIFLMGFYHLALFFLRKKEVALLYFGLFCLLVCFRMSLSTLLIFYDIFPNTDWTWMLKADYLSLILVGLTLASFTYFLFPKEWNKWVFRIMIGLGLLICLIIIVSPIQIASWIIPFTQGCLFLGLLYVLSIVSIAIFRKRVGAITLFVSMMAFFLVYGAFFFEISFSDGIISLPDYVAFLFVFSQSWLLSRKFANSHSLSETYAQTFQKFVPVQFLHRIAKDGIKSIKLGGAEKEDGVILFCDIRGFTPLAENLSPDEVLDFLNIYFSRMELPIRKGGGFVDKYLGDAIMALFMLETSEKSTSNAIVASLEMLVALKTLNAERERESLSPLEIGIGLHYGPLIIGTIGGTERMDSTAIGDAVNLASRIEGMTKQYNVPILVSEEMLVAGNAKAHFYTRFVDQVKVKGKSIPVRLWEVLGSKEGPEKPELSQALSTYEKGIKAFFARDFEGAQLHFSAYLKINPEDVVAEMYIDRCKQFIQHGIEQGWSGVTDLNS